MEMNKCTKCRSVSEILHVLPCLYLVCSTCLGKRITIYPFILDVGKTFSCVCKTEMKIENVKNFPILPKSNVKECEQRNAEKHCATCKLNLCGACSDKIHSGKRTKTHPIAGIACVTIERKSKEMDEILAKIVKVSKSIDIKRQELKEKKFFSDEGDVKNRDLILASCKTLENAILKQKSDLLEQYASSANVESTMKKLDEYYTQLDDAISFTNQIKNNTSVSEYEYPKIQQLCENRMKVLIELDSSAIDAPKTKMDHAKFVLQVSNIEKIILEGFKNTPDIQKGKSVEKVIEKARKVQDSKDDVDLQKTWGRLTDDFRDVEQRFKKLRVQSLNILETSVSTLKKSLNPSDFSSLTENLHIYYENEKLLKSLVNDHDLVSFANQFLQAKL